MLILNSGSGIVPVRLLYDTLKRRNSVSVFRLLGSRPVSRLLLNDACCIFGQRVGKSGERVPLSLLKDKSI